MEWIPGDGTVRHPRFAFPDSVATPRSRAVNPVTTPSASTVDVTVGTDRGLPSGYVVPD